MSLRAAFGLDPESVPAVRRLSALLMLTTGAEILVEGVVLSAFLARIGASALPTALALRAVVEVVASLLLERGLSRRAPGRAMLVVVVLGMLVFGGSAVALSSAAGLYTAYVAVSVIARVKTIHFGVLSLAELSGPSAARALPVVQAGGRLGGVFAGPVIAFSGPVVGAPWMLALGALLYAIALVFSLRSRVVLPDAGPVSAVEPTDASGSRLLRAIVLGAIALALGRLALVSQSGAILERAYGEADLNRVLGMYFSAANLLAFVLQAFVVGRVLGAGGLPLLNAGWAGLYLAAQSWLSFGPPSVVGALSARWVESELRNAVRTPVANLLYEAIPERRRAFARTLVIGVAVPLASLVGGLGLRFFDGHPTALGTLGFAAAVVILLTTGAQNRAWRRV